MVYDWENSHSAESSGEIQAFYDSFFENDEDDSELT